MAQQWDMKTFMKGASILTISAIIVKLLGAVYRVPFQNLVGDKRILYLSASISVHWHFYCLDVVWFCGGGIETACGKYESW